MAWLSECERFFALYDNCVRDISAKTICMCAIFWNRKNFDANQFGRVSGDPVNSLYTFRGKVTLKSYEVQLEIAGNTAMWTRPDTGDCPVSYPAPTLSAVRGIFESILWGPVIKIEPTKVEICKPLHFHAYSTNYNGPLKKSGTDGAYQFLATVLTDVCYRMYAKVLENNIEDAMNIPDQAKMWLTRTKSPGHAYQEIFNRRLKHGQWFVLPCLGWKEFTPSYIGIFRNGARIQDDINTVLPSMLREVFHGGHGMHQPRFIYDQNVRIEYGVLSYEKENNND
jgi:CRISPR-associated protein Cas5d